MCQGLYNLLVISLTGKDINFFYDFLHFVIGSIMTFRKLVLLDRCCHPVCGTLALTPYIKELFLTMMLTIVTKVALNSEYLVNMSSSYGSLR